MITRGATLISRMAVAFAILFAIAACGGGGGGGSVGNFLPDTNDGSTYFLSLVLLDSDGNPNNTVTSAAPAILEVTVTKKNKNGAAIADVVVSAQTDIGEVLPASGTALTNTDGVAAFQIVAGDDKGAGTITASADSDDGTFTASLAFQIGSSGLRLGYIDADGDFIENQIGIQPQEMLAVGGNAQLTVAVLNQEGEPVGTSEEITFSSGCTAAGQAVLNPENPVKSVNGQASTTYTATGCSGVDVVTASLVGAAAQATGDVSIASPAANAVNFVSAEPLIIVLRGTGGLNRSETSNVVFNVVDSTGTPLAGIPVALSLTTEIGGLSLSTSSAQSNGDGDVQVTVSSGDVATTVRVVATVDGGNGETVATVSDLLTVTTGLPDQDSISLSVGECGGEGGFMVADGLTIDRKCRELTVAMADKFNNPVVDGTAATFTTEYGVIVGSCTTLGGTCSVQWDSQEPRFPLLSGNTFVKTIEDGSNCPCPQDLGYTRGGRSTITVRAQGEESFIDRNGNGIMDQEEKDLFDNLPEAFLDRNEDDAYTPGLPSCLADPSGTAQCIAGIEEIFFDYNNNQQYDLNDDPAVYNGLLCPPEGDGVWCSRDLVEVRADTVVTLLGSGFRASVSGSTVRFSDFYNNPPASGSTVTLKENDGCKVIGEKVIVVPAIFGTGAIKVPVATSPSGGTVTVTLAPVGGGIRVSETLACEPAPREEEGP
jgi:hypothetical protein